MSGFTGHEVATTVNTQPPLVTYHQTAVAQILGPHGTHVLLRTGGWRTVTTKRRMNQAAEHWGRGFRVYQKDRSWFVSFFASDDDRADLSFGGESIQFAAPKVEWDTGACEWMVAP